MLSNSSRRQPRKLDRFGFTHVAIASLLLLLPAIASRVEASTPRPYLYLSPMPEARDVSPRTGIVMRAAAALDPSTIARTPISVVGSQTGAHAGSLSLSDDSRTLVFKPDLPFSPGEAVVVSLARGPQTLTANELPGVSFGFSVSTLDPATARHADLEDVPAEVRPRPGFVTESQPTGPSINAPPGLPANYPAVTLTLSNSPDPGCVFITPTRPGTVTALLTVDNLGYPIFYRRTPGRVADFKLQPTRLLTYFDALAFKFYGLDSTYAVVDSFATGNGYLTDSHELLVLPNGHFVLMAYYNRAVAMDTVVVGGNPNAIVTETAIQELDAARNVVFEWRTEDHFRITDFAYCRTALTDSLIEYTHGNSIEVDLDGNLIVSFRRMNEVTKIDRQTGDIIWRFGGNARNNQFAIVDDPRGFTDQHDARRLPNGHLTIFDNGSCNVPAYTRALEYELDELNMIATLVWSFRNTPDQVAPATGNMQRRANGGSTIGWGQAPTNPKVTELHPDGTKAFELSYTPATISGYRAFRFPWQTGTFVTDVQSLDFGSVNISDTAAVPLTITNRTGFDLPITNFWCTDSAFIVPDAVPITIPAGGSATVQVRFHPSAEQTYAGVLYVRSINATDVIAQPVSVTGLGVAPTASLFSLLEAGWSDDGIEVRWQLPSPGAIVTSTLERSETEEGPWMVVTGERSENGSLVVVLDRGAVAGRSYFYRIVTTDRSGQVRTSEPFVATGAARQAEFALLAVAPSPSRGPTRIAYSVPREARVRLSVLDIQGRVVAVLADAVHLPGRYQAAWNGERRGRAAPAGLYFVRFEWPGDRSVRRLVLAP